MSPVCICGHHWSRHMDSQVYHGEKEWCCDCQCKMFEERVEAEKEKS